MKDESRELIEQYKDMYQKLNEMSKAFFRYEPMEER